MTIKVAGVEVEVSNDCEVTVEGTKVTIKPKLFDWKVGWLPNYQPWVGPITWPYGTQITCGDSNTATKYNKTEFVTGISVK